MTISNAVEESIKHHPFLEGALYDGLINISALARKLKPEVEIRAGKEVNDSAIIMSLNRLIPQMEVLSEIKIRKVIDNISDIIVRSNLADYAFENSVTLFEKQAALLERSHAMKDAFCTFSQGIFETTLVVSRSISPLVDEIFANEKLLSKSNNLSSITVRLPTDNNIYPGIYYYIFKQLAWDNINIDEVISTTNEFTVVLSDSDVNRAFTILMDSKKR